MLIFAPFRHILTNLNRRMIISKFVFFHNVFITIQNYTFINSVQYFSLSSMLYAVDLVYVVKGKDVLLHNSSKKGASYCVYMP